MLVIYIQPGDLIMEEGEHHDELLMLSKGSGQVSTLALSVAEQCSRLC